MGFTIRETDCIPPRLRAAYLDSLREAQEFYLERLVSTGSKVLLEQGSEVAGYAVLSGRSVVEFFLLPGAASGGAEAFAEVLKFSGASSALCKSFDKLMLDAATFMPARTRLGGFLFRKITDPSFHPDSSITILPATEEGIGEILQMHDGFFDSREEILSYVNESGLFLYRQGDALAGCGMFKRIIPGRDHFDVGMVVAPGLRRKGLGSFIVAHVKAHCLRQGYIPVCGCHADNTASRRSLEKAGFVSEHRIVEVSY